MSVTTEDARGHATSYPIANAAAAGRSLKVDLQLNIKRPPRSVRAWWTDLPDDYVAKDPREEPHRIRILERAGNRIELVGTWRGPLGRDTLLRETLRLRADGTWTFDAQAMGLRIHDEFEAVPQGDGTRLHVQSTARPTGLKGKIVARLMGRRLVRMLTEGMETAAQICERDAP